MSVETRIVETENGPVAIVMGHDEDRHRLRDEVARAARRVTLPALLASAMALAAPMTSGQPPLDTGEREHEITLSGPAPRRRRTPERRTIDGSLPDRDTVPNEVQVSLLNKAQAKRARRAKRGW